MVLPRSLLQHSLWLHMGLRRIYALRSAWQRNSLSLPFSPFWVLLSSHVPNMYPMRWQLTERSQPPSRLQLPSRLRYLLT
jgi:hypothetical protein